MSIQVSEAPSGGAHGFEPWQVWAERDRAEQRFVVEGLVHGGATIVTGRPFAGKTTLTAAMVAAVARKDPAFLGHRVALTGNTLVAVTDPREANSWGRRMAAHDVPEGAVDVAQYPPADWSALVAEVVRRRPTLFVLDNILGAITGDVRDNQTAQALLSDLNRIIGAGVAVLAIHHSSAKPFEDGKTYSREPMGSTAYGAWARLTVHVQETASGSLKVTTHGNDSASAELSLSVAVNDDGRGVYEVVSETATTDKRPRKADTLEDRRAFATTHIIGNAELVDVRSQRAVAGALSAALGRPVSQSEITRSLAAIGGAEHVPGRGWVPKVEAG